MGKKGFTLIESIIGLFLLGLIAVTTLPIINSSFITLRNHDTKLQMVYTGEMVIEKIKAFNMESNSDVLIYDTTVYELIQLFRSNDSIEVKLPKNDNNEKFSLTIIKNQKSDYLWMLSVYVYDNKEGSNIGHVEYTAYLWKK